MPVPLLRRLCLLLASFSLILAPTPAGAMNVSPMVLELTTRGAATTGRIQLSNVLKQNLPYEVRMYRVDVTADGKTVETPADGDFIVYPPQGVVKPEERQMIRLQWVGGEIAASQGYYASINQVPVPLDPAKADKTKASVEVQLVYHIKVLVTVAPPGAEPKIKVVSARPTSIAPRDPATGSATAASKVPGVAVTVANSGARYAMLAGVNWTIEGTGTDGKPLKLVLPKSRMGELLGAGYVPALKGERTFEIPTGAGFADKPIRVRFSD